jgi:hypothetical protein
MVRKIIVKSLLLSLILIGVGARPALAYIDPSAGGMLFQILAVAFASISAVVLIFSRQIRMLFARGRRALRSVFGGEAEPVQASSDPSDETVQPSEMTDPQ